MRHIVMTLGAALLLAGCAASTPAATPTPSPGTKAAASPVRSPPASGTAGASSSGGKCQQLYAVGIALTQTLSCLAASGTRVSVGTYTCIGPERLGRLDASSGVVPSVWFTVPGVVAAVHGGKLAADQAYVAAYKKCTGVRPRRRVSPMLS